jgi:hypothetical protein
VGALAGRQLAVVAIALADLNMNYMVVAAEVGIPRGEVHYIRVGMVPEGHSDMAQERLLVILFERRWAQDTTEGCQKSSPRNWRGRVLAFHSACQSTNPHSFRRLFR